MDEATLPLTGGRCVHITGPAGTAIILAVRGIVDPPLETIESMARVTGLPVYIVDGVAEVLPLWMVDGERAKRQIEFLEILADGGNLTVNGIPWRETFETLNTIVADGLPPEPVAP